MNFLELTQQTASLASIPGFGPVTTVGQTGELARVVTWVRNAWLDIERRHQYWNFKRKDLFFTTTLGQQNYGLVRMGAADLAEYDGDSLRLYDATVGVSSEQFLVEWDYNVFRDLYQFSQQTPGRPTVFAINPADKDLLLGSIPDSGQYVVRGKYWRQAAGPVDNTSVPAFPEAYHDVIVQRALMKYAGYEAAPEVKQTAMEEYRNLMRELERDQLPALSFGESLA